jgi:hypothetical protein
MNRRSRLIVLLGAAVTLAAAGSALAAVTPPAGTPNLALMAIQPSDLAAGAVTGADVGYDTPPSGFTAEYAGYFTSAATSDGVAYSLLQDDISLAPDTTTASEYVAVEKLLYTSKAGRKAIVKAAIKDAGGKKSHLTLSDFKFSGAESAGVGTGSLVETLTVTYKRKKVREVILVFDDGTVAGSLVATGKVNEKVPQSDAITLGTAMYTHINAVLAAGATGPSGTTGASGAS